MTRPRKEFTKLMHAMMVPQPIMNVGTKDTMSPIHHAKNRILAPFGGRKLFENNVPINIVSSIQFPVG